MAAALLGLPARPHGQTLSDGVQPTADARSPADGTGSPRQDDERRLKGIFGVLLMAEDPSAHAPDQSGMSPHHDGKGILIVVGYEGVQQLAVAALGGVGDAVELSQVIENAM